MISRQFIGVFTSESTYDRYSDPSETEVSASLCQGVIESLNDLLSKGVCVQGNEPHDSFSDVRYYNCL